MISDFEAQYLITGKAYDHGYYDELRWNRSRWFRIRNRIYNCKQNAEWHRKT